MAVACIDTIRLHARRKGKLPIIGVYGTPYHVNGESGEDWENVLASRAEFQKIGSHEWPEVNGYVFDIKHKIGSSSIPHGRSTSIEKDMLWNLIWAVNEMQPRARMLLRGHVHYHQFTGNVRKTGMTLPPLQAMGTKYGGRQCSGLVDWGMTTFDVSSDGAACDWRTHTVTIKTQVAHTTKVGE